MRRRRAGRRRPLEQCAYAWLPPEKGLSSTRIDTRCRGRAQRPMPFKTAGNTLDTGGAGLVCSLGPRALGPRASGLGPGAWGLGPGAWSLGPDLPPPQDAAQLPLEELPLAGVAHQRERARVALGRVVERA